MTLLINGALLIYFLKQDNQSSSQNKWNLLYPYLANLDEDEFENTQKYYRSEVLDLKVRINESLRLPDGVRYAIYFESLNTGAYIGINEKEKLIPASLRKVPLVAATYKKIENSELRKEDLVTLLDEDLNQQSGVLWQAEPGTSITVNDLIKYTLVHSDNTATNALMRLVGMDNYVEAMFNMGMSYKTYLANKNQLDYPLSPKEYSNVFRTLYYSSWINRDDSQEMLFILAHSVFNQGIPAGVPSNIVVSHKTGNWAITNDNSDCGIVYYPNNPYILCIMISGLEQDSANEVTKNISRITYEYIDELVKKDRN